MTLHLLEIINAAAVGLFGAFLSASFCDIKWTRNNKVIFGLTVIILGAVQVALFVIGKSPFYSELYPVITHLPLALVLAFLCRKLFWGFVSVFTAYLCCQLRRWVALLCLEIFSGGPMMQEAVEIIVTVPFLLLILRFASGAIRGMSHYSPVVQFQFSLIPIVSYFADYLTRIYTDWLIQGIPAATEFMPFVCSLAYLFFVVHNVRLFRRQSELEQLQSGLDLQVKQSVREMEALRRSQEQAAASRHDMRHHLQFLSTCIESGNLDQAKNYIYNLDGQLKSQAIIQYCENTSLNWILSSFAGRAEDRDVEMDVNVHLGKGLAIEDGDLCVLLSNALENALRACEKVEREGEASSIVVDGYEKNGKVFVQITNTFAGTILFRDGIPVTNQDGHGLGVRSICAIVEKYEGIYSFSTKDNQFILRFSL